MLSLFAHTSLFDSPRFLSAQFDGLITGSPCRGILDTPTGERTLVDFSNGYRIAVTIRFRQNRLNPFANNTFDLYTVSNPDRDE